MKTEYSFFKSFAIVVLATIAFIGFKQFLPKKIFSEKAPNSKNVVVDSLLLEAVDTEITVEAKDTVVAKDIVFSQTEGIVFPPETFESYKGFQYLISFFEKLYELEQDPESENVRIAYFGDSMTDGDLIVKDLRTSFQERFGGQGVGFVSITSESAASRSSITHEYSKNWKTQSYLNVKRARSPFGVNGHVFFADDTTHTTWIRFKANYTKFATSLNNPTLFYGKSGNYDGKVRIIIGKDTISKPLVPNNAVNTLKIASSIKSFKTDFIEADSIPIFGFNFDDGKGVHVDNFSQRGNSGLPISTFNPSIMQAFNAKLGYDLIVLHYGTNVLNYGTKDYTWYDRSMTKTVNHLKECFPGVSILIISTADKATKYDLEMKTDSAVMPLTVAQKRYALKTQSGFVNLYTLMGGDGSMVKWVEEEPSKANKDYTHFNHRGAKKISELLYEQLNQGYEKYKILRKKRKLEPKKPVDSTTIKKDSANA